MIGLAPAATSVHRRLAAGDLTAAPGDAVALRSVRRAFATTGRPAVLPDRSREYVAPEPRRAAGRSVGRTMHTVLHALAPPVGPQPRDEAA